MAITRFEDLPSTNTSINSEHLNDNFDELGVKVGTSVDNNYRTNIIKELNGNASIVVDGEEIYSKPVVLFNNVNGSNEDITLNDNSNNYKYIDIYYKQQNGTYSFIRALPNTTVVLSAPHVTNEGYAIGWSARNIKISGNKITTDTTNRYLFINVVSTNSLSGASKTNYVYITKVVGYK